MSLIGTLRRGEIRAPRRKSMTRRLCQGTRRKSGRMDGGGGGSGGGGRTECRRRKDRPREMLHRRVSRHRGNGGGGRSRRRRRMEKGRSASLTLCLTLATHGRKKHLPVRTNVVLRQIQRVSDDAQFGTEAIPRFEISRTDTIHGIALVAHLLLQDAGLCDETLQDEQTLLRRFVVRVELLEVRHRLCDRTVRREIVVLDRRE